MGLENGKRRPRKGTDHGSGKKSPFRFTEPHEIGDPSFHTHLGGGPGGAFGQAGVHVCTVSAMAVPFTSCAKILRSVIHGAGGWLGLSSFGFGSHSRLAFAGMSRFGKPALAHSRNSSDAKASTPAPALQAWLECILRIPWFQFLPSKETRAYVGFYS